MSWLGLDFHIRLNRSEADSQAHLRQVFSRRDALESIGLSLSHAGRFDYYQAENTVTLDWYLSAHTCLRTELVLSDGYATGRTFLHQPPIGAVYLSVGLAFGILLLITSLPQALLWSGVGLLGYVLWMGALCYRMNGRLRRILTQ